MSGKFATVDGDADTDGSKIVLTRGAENAVKWTIKLIDEYTKAYNPALDDMNTFIEAEAGEAELGEGILNGIAEGGGVPGIAPGVSAPEVDSDRGECN